MPKFWNDFGLEHPEITRVRGLGTSWWDDMEELAERLGENAISVKRETE